MKKRRLRDIEASEVGMGCMAFSHGYGQIPDEQYDPWSQWLKTMQPLSGTLQPPPRELQPVAAYRT